MSVAKIHPFQESLPRRRGATSATPMKTNQLHDLLAGIVRRNPGVRLILAGSQALYGHTQFVPDIVKMSMEADLLLTGDAFRARRDIEGEFGMESLYQGETGIYAHPVGLGTITLPKGWEER